MRLDELPRSDNVEDRRGDGSGGFPMGRTGGIGIGTIILLGLIGWALGINPLYLIGGAEILSGLGGSQQQSQPAPGNAKTEAPPDQMGEFVSAVLGSTEVQWKEIFAQAGKTYEAPTLVMFSGATRSACGFAQSAMGPLRGSSNPHPPNPDLAQSLTSMASSDPQQRQHSERTNASAPALAGPFYFGRDGGVILEVSHWKCRMSSTIRLR